MKPAYYNEFEPYAAAWLRNLIIAGHIPAGEVDERSIVDVSPADLSGFGQCHFFAGIGGWALAARLAGMPDAADFWTGSAPCQPFSVAGQGKAQADDRHLWPHLFRIVAARRPALFMGEQVAAAVGKNWLDGVFADLESVGYACGAVVVPACAVDAPHRRDRLWFVADGAGERRALALLDGSGGAATSGVGEAGEPGVRGARGAVGDAERARLQGLAGDVAGAEGGRHEPHRPTAAAGVRSGAVADADIAGASEGWQQRGGELGGAGGHTRACAGALSDAAGITEREPHDADSAIAIGRTARALLEQRSHWDAAAWIVGHDGKARRVESGLRLLAHGVPARVGKLRAYGNAIVPQVAAEVIGAWLDCQP